MRDIACQYTSTEESNTLTHETSELGIDRNMITTPSLHKSPTFQPHLLQSTFDPNLFDSFFSEFGSCSSIPPLDLALPSPQHIDSEGLTFFNYEDRQISSGMCQSNLTLSNQPQFTPQSSSIDLANHSMELIFRVFRTWPQMLAEEFQQPPIFHSTHFSQHDALPRPLATCITLGKMWHGQCLGAEEIVRSTILRELNLIVDRVSLNLCLLELN